MFTRSNRLILAAGISLAIAAMSNVAVADEIIDARQESQIWTTYVLNPYLRAYDINVSVNDGKATLTGIVEEDVNKSLAKQIALGVSGITEVDNQLLVKADYVPPARSAERSFGEAIDDATIIAAVKSKLMWSKYTDGIMVDVDSNLGKVTLKGTADSPDAKILARGLAMNTYGVKSVDNQLVVDTKKPKTTEQAISDGWITTKVKSTYMYSNNVNGTDISVNSDKGVVTLSGKVNSGSERSLAIELAQNVRGVNSVVSKDLVF